MLYSNLREDEPMPSLPISKVRENLFGFVKQVNDDHDTLTVVTKTGENAVLVAEADWNSLMETLYVLQTHGGIQLLKSAADARAGRTVARALIDPDAAEPASPEDGEGESAEAEVIRLLLSELIRRGATPEVIHDLLGERLSEAVENSGA
ncbi:type II toxin-antitoxin system Phd/YefM family antitoxin [Nocardia sp. NPDC005746]|uniref:type II toxin-antitoxin system Phd/YefM family antitoxin n=1 Tax=Nocardia sp. NPDC005746 TaxID=3157062 RepID=UPI0033E9A1B5